MEHGFPGLILATLRHSQGMSFRDEDYALAFHLYWLPVSENSEYFD